MSTRGCVAPTAPDSREYEDFETASSLYASSAAYHNRALTALGLTFVNRYRCIDPTAPCVDDDLITAEMVENCGFIKGYGVRM